MNEFDLPQVLTVDEAARALRVSPESVRRWLRDGSMQGVKFGHTWRVARDEVLRVLQEGVKPVSLAGGRQVSREAIHAAVGEPDGRDPRIQYPGPVVMGDADIRRGGMEASGRAPLQARIIG